MRRGEAEEQAQFAAIGRGVLGVASALLLALTLFLLLAGVAQW